MSISTPYNDWILSHEENAGSGGAAAVIITNGHLVPFGYILIFSACTHRITSREL